MSFILILLILATVFSFGLYFLGRWLRDTGSRPKDPPPQ